MNNVSLYVELLSFSLLLKKYILWSIKHIYIYLRNKVRSVYIFHYSIFSFICIYLSISTVSCIKRKSSTFHVERHLILLHVLFSTNMHSNLLKPYTLKSFNSSFQRKLLKQKALKSSMAY